MWINQSQEYLTKLKYGDGSPAVKPYAVEKNVKILGILNER